MGKKAHYSRKPNYVILLNHCNGTRFVVDATEEHEEILIIPLKRKGALAHSICQLHPTELAVFDSLDDASKEAELLAKKERRKIVPPDEVMRRVTRHVPKRRKKK